MSDHWMGSHEKCMTYVFCLIASKTTNMATFRKEMWFITYKQQTSKYKICQDVILQRHTMGYSTQVCFVLGNSKEVSTPVRVILVGF